MERKARIILVSVFLVLTVVGIWIFYDWINSSTNAIPLEERLVEFQGSVSGLSIGSDVRYLGVPVGRVSSIELSQRRAGRVDVIIGARQRLPASMQLVAILEGQGITGLSVIELRDRQPDEDEFDVPADAIPGAFRKALALEPEHEVAQLSLAECYRQMINFDEAKKTIEEASLSHPDSPAPHLAMGRLNIDLQLWEQAADNLLAALEIDPSNTAARVFLASVYKSNAEFEAALEELDLAIAAEPDNAMARYFRGSIYADRNDSAKALPDAERVVELEPDVVRGRYLLASILVREGQCTTGAEHLEKALAQEPNHTESASLLARAYQCAGETEKAGQARQRFAQLAKQDHEERESGTQADHLVREAREHAQEGRPNEALQILQRALQQDPDNDSAFTLLAKIQYSAGRYDIAKEAAEVALQHNPYRSDTLYVLGRALRQLGDLEGARAVFTQTTLINPLDTEALSYLAQVHIELDDREGAIVALERALELEPENESFAAALAAVKAGG